MIYVCTFLTTYFYHFFHWTQKKDPDLSTAANTDQLSPFSSSLRLHFAPVILNPTSKKRALAPFPPSPAGYIR